MNDLPADDNPATAVVNAVEQVLDLARTWPAWDGEPVTADDGRLFTRHKAIRRTADHIVDHLSEVEALLAGAPTEDDRWLASALTSPADRAPFTADDVTEATQRLRRLALTFVLRYAAAGPEARDAPRGDNWTLREIAAHLGDPWYAEQVGDLS